MARELPFASDIWSQYIMTFAADGMNSESKEATRLLKPGVRWFNPADAIADDQVDNVAI